MRCCCRIAQTQVEVPLRHVHSRVEIAEFTAQTTLRQVYKNVEKTPIEAVYQFPMDPAIAVRSFIIFSRGKRIVSDLKPKEEALATYDDAMSAGQGAYMLEQKTSTTLEASVGNLAPGQKIVVEITYVQDLLPDGAGSVRYVLPTAVAPKYEATVAADDTQSADEPASDDESGGDGDDTAAQPASAAPAVTSSMLSRRMVSPALPWSAPPPFMWPIVQPRQVWQAVMKRPTYKLGFELSVELSSAIQGLSSPTHKDRLVTQINGKVAMASLTLPALMDRDLVVVIAPSDPFVPRALAQTDAAGRVALAATFIAPLPDELDHDREIIFVVDRSGSMNNGALEDAKKALQVFLRGIPEGSTFNIYSFGSRFEAMYGTSQKYNDSTLSYATRHVNQMSANMGGTEILAPLRAIFASKPQGRREIFVLTDGQVSNVDSIVADIAQHAGSQTRVFSFGVGSSVDANLVRRMATAGCGAAEFLVEGEKMDAKVMRQLRRALSPGLINVSLSMNDASVMADWLVSPGVMPNIFGGDMFRVFALHEKPVPKDIIEKLQISIHATNAVTGAPFTATIPVTCDSGAHADSIHALAARAIINELAARQSFMHNVNGTLLEGRTDLDVSALLLQLSLQYSVLSAATSFVAVEETDTPVTEAAQQRRVPSIAVVTHASALQGQRIGKHGTALASNIMRRKLAAAAPQMMLSSSAGSGSRPGSMSTVAPPPPSAPMAMFDSAGGHELKKKTMSSAVSASASKPSMARQQEQQQQEQPIGAGVVVSLQRADGSWPETAAAVVLVRLRVSKDKAQASCSALGVTMDVLVTALAVALLEDEFFDEEDVWGLSVRKARKWLEKVLRAVLNAVSLTQSQTTNSSDLPARALAIVRA